MKKILITFGLLLSVDCFAYARVQPVTLYSDKKTMSSVLGGGTVGAYHSTKNLILLSSDDKNIRHSRYHEQGHAIWFQSFNDYGKATWFNLYLTNRMPSKYANTNAEEGFAECYAFYKMSLSNKAYKGKLTPELQNYFKILNKALK